MAHRAAGWCLPAIAAVAVLSAGGKPTFGAGGGPHEQSKPTTETADDLRAIFTKEAARDVWSPLLRRQQGFWTPTPSDVRGLEARLPTYLRSPKARKAAA